MLALNVQQFVTIVQFLARKRKYKNDGEVHSIE
jgi:hypothetical protein